jgi:hypothetical protein|eukprot:COSAG06_NODE_3152_length_5767_cov_9.071101_4_plen_174_part_00
MGDEQTPLTGEAASPPEQRKEPADDDDDDDDGATGLIYQSDDEDDGGATTGAVRLIDARPSSVLMENYLFHASLCGGFFGLGIVLCMLGPTLLDLADQANGASVREITLLFTSRSFAYLLGSILGGYLLEKMENTCAMLAVAMYLVAIGSAGLPLCTEIWSMGCFMGCAGVAM